MSTTNGNNKIQLESPSNKIFQIPNWINEKLFLDIIKCQYGDPKKIIHFAVTPASKPGEKISSTMFRVTIYVETLECQTKNLSFILKTNQNDDSMLAVLETLMFFHKEQEMYTTVIPKLESLFLGIKKPVRFGPQTYKFTHNPPVEYVLLEDVSKMNFRTPNRQLGMDMPHMEQTLAKLAQFHAASACLHELNGPYGEQFMCSIFSEKYRSIFTTINNSKLFLSHLNKWKNCARYAEKLAESDKNLVVKIMQAGKYNPSEFNVLNHGDFWTNNIMFHYDAFGKIKSTYFMDFQNCKYGSPAYDLYYLILTSAQMKIKLTEFDYMIKFYHDHLIENLKLLGYHRPLPKLRNLHISLLKNGLTAYLIVSQVLPIVMMEEDVIRKTYTDDDFKLKTPMFNNRSYVRAMEVILPWLDNRGLLDF